MKIKTRLKVLVLICLSLAFSISKSQNVQKKSEKEIQKLVSSMTLEEKASYVVGTNIGPVSLIKIDKSKKDTLPSNAGTTYPIPRLGLPITIFSDGPAGLTINPKRAFDPNKMYYSTSIPIGSLMASTWDTTMVYQVGEIVGDEALKYGVDIWLGPSMNIHRNPLNGRNFEYYSEDPFVAGKLAAAMVKGAQSNGIASTLKHFAANNTETNRFGLNTIVSQRALREIYLEGFRIAVTEAKPKAIMSSYNLINNVYTPQNRDLITKVLREDWGYKGFVMTDWWSGDDPVAKVAAGNDLIMPGSVKESELILQAVKDGKLDEKQLDTNVKNIVNFVTVSPRYNGYKYQNNPDLKAHAELVRQAASEGMILLKNNNETLPLSTKDSKIAVFGITSFDVITGGFGSGASNPAYKVSLVDGLKNTGFNLNPQFLNTYENYISTEKTKQSKSGFSLVAIPKRIDEMDLDNSSLNKVASESDIAIITIGRFNGEQFDRKVDDDFNLTSGENKMIRSITESFHKQGKKVLVVLNVCGIVEMASWRDMPDAILLAWAGGQETGNSIADIISGKVNPSGKLAVSIPMDYKQVPSAKNFPGVVTGPERNFDMLFIKLPYYPAKVVYEEGIYNGYRYYESFGVTPAYEFGFGKSYTTFEYGKVKLSKNEFKDEIRVSLNIKNSGKVAGKEVVQLYLTAPAQKLDKPAIELKGFAKTRLLQPNELQTVEFTISKRNLASFDASVSSWIAEAGTYEVKIGASSKDIRQKATFILKKELLVKKENNALTPPEKINELKAPISSLRGK